MYEFVQILRVTQPWVAKQLGRRHSKHRLFFEALEGRRKGGWIGNQAIRGTEGEGGWREEEVGGGGPSAWGLANL